MALFGRQALADDAGVSADGHGYRGVMLAMNLASPADVDAAFSQWVAYNPYMPLRPDGSAQPPD